jgi:hypothetical protein
MQGGGTHMARLDGGVHVLSNDVRTTGILVPTKQARLLLCGLEALLLADRGPLHLGPSQISDRQRTPVIFSFGLRGGNGSIGGLALQPLLPLLLLSR